MVVTVALLPSTVDISAMVSLDSIAPVSAATPPSLTRGIHNLALTRVGVVPRRRRQHVDDLRVRVKVRVRVRDFVQMPVQHERGHEKVETEEAVHRGVVTGLRSEKL